MIVRLKPGIDPYVEAPRLARKHHFTVREYFGALPVSVGAGFGADLDARIVAALRCEATVLDLTFGETNIPPP